MQSHPLSESDLDVLMEKVRRELNPASATAASAGSVIKAPSAAWDPHAPVAASVAHVGARRGWYFNIAHRIKLRFGQVPLLGACLRYVHHAARLPLTMGDIQQQMLQRLTALSDAVNRVDRVLIGEVGAVAGTLDAQIADIRGQVNALSEVLQAQISEMRGQVGILLGAFDPQLADMRGHVSALSEVFQGQLSEIRGQVGILSGGLEAQLADMRGDVSALSEVLGSISAKFDSADQRLAVLLRSKAASEMAPSSDQTGAPELESEGHAARIQFDSLYTAFEDRFRGTREDIKNRLTVHIGRVLEIQASARKLPVIDIGCGRGEWLELLRDARVAALGVDTNAIMVAECVKRGFPAIQGDALAHLRNMEEGAASAITGFHIIEHLPFDKLLQILREAMRVLAPGGLVIFETPNPENLITAAHRFYYDPTHRNPIPPDLAAFLLRANGYRDIEIVRLHENSDSARDEISSPVLRQLLFGPQDFAIVGWK
jgi:SAM-dependent methyltransferase